jgi:hypothetical protein
MDLTQLMRFTLPVNQITYTVSGFGIAGVCIRQIYVEKQQQQIKEQIPFEVSHELLPMPWFSEIKAKTCLTYTPTVRDQKLAKENFNRTVVVEVQLPSGMRVNHRQIGFLLSHVENVMYYTFDERCNKINFFMNVPSTHYGKQICMDWCLERLSFVTSWAPIEIRVYDYLVPEIQLVRLFPIQLQPNLLGYSFVDAVHKARPTLEQLQNLQRNQPSTRV